MNRIALRLSLHDPVTAGLSGYRKTAGFCRFAGSIAFSFILGTMFCTPVHADPTEKPTNGQSRNSQRASILPNLNPAKAPLSVLMNPPPGNGPTKKTSGAKATSSVPTAKNNVAYMNFHPIELDGEVVDTWCFASKAVLGGRGPAHYKCADACAHGGVTLGIVDDKGILYIAAKTKAYTGCQALLEPFVARRVHIMGDLAQAGGCNILKITTVRLSTDKPQPKLPIDNLK